MLFLLFLAVSCFFYASSDLKGLALYLNTSESAMPAVMLFKIAFLF